MLQVPLVVMERLVRPQRNAVVGRHRVLVISVQLIAIVTLVRAARILQAHLAVTEHRELLQKYVVAELAPQERAIIALQLPFILIVIVVRVILLHQVQGVNMEFFVQSTNHVAVELLEVQSVMYVKCETIIVLSLHVRLMAELIIVMAGIVIKIAEVARKVVVVGDNLRRVSILLCLNSFSMK